MLCCVVFILNTYMAIKIRNYDNLNNLSKDSHIFKDIKFDIDWSKNNTIDNIDQKLLQQESIRGSDINALYDEEAIKTSIYNLFNTSRGQRFLFPEYGVNFKKYLFMPLDDTTARMLGDDVRDAITKFEKRVKVLKVHVDMYSDTQTLVVSIVLFSDILAKSIGYKMEISQINASQKIDVYSSGSF